MAEALEKPRGSEPALPSDALTEAELTIIEGRAAAATPGPWKFFLEGRDHIVPAPIEDQDFVGHARQDVPRLVAEVRRLRELKATPSA